jgi:hypothetical protein
MSSQSLTGFVSLSLVPSFERNTDGTWSALTGTDMHVITSIATGPDGSRYVASWDSSGDQGYVLKEVSGVWTTVGSSFAEDVRDLVVVSDNEIYAAATTGVWTWDGATWSQSYNSGVSYSYSVGNNLQGIGSLAFGWDGKLYAAGIIPSVATGVVCYDGSTWSAVTGGPSGDINTLHAAPDGLIYVGRRGFPSPTDGIFVSAYNPDTGVWRAVGSLDDDIYRIISVPGTNRLYACGEFAAAVVQWSGAAWLRLGNLNSAISNLTYWIAIDQDTRLYATGFFDFDGNNPLPERAQWNGFSWVPLYSPDTRYVFVWPDGRLLTSVFGFFSGFLPASQVVTVSGSAGAHPVFEFTATSSNEHVYEIANYSQTPTRYIHLIENNTTNLAIGERIVVDTRPAQRSVTKYDASGNATDITAQVFAGSDLATLRLLPGDNNISIFASTQLTCTVEWADLHMTGRAV